MKSKNNVKISYIVKSANISPVAAINNEFNSIGTE